MSSFVERDAWFKNVKTTFERQLLANVVANVCVFQVPKSLSSVAPEAYAPQIVGLGPYHHLRPEVQEMHSVKLDATCRFFRGTKYGSFTGLTARLSKLDQDVRACYQKFLELNDNQLAWIMAVDSSFLFDFLCRHIDKKTLKSSEWLRDLAKPVGWKLAEHAILRDVMMLENQIPIFFMVEMLTILCSTLDPTDQKRFVEHVFPEMLVAFCQALSPIKQIKTDPLAKALKSAHLLDLLYRMVVPEGDESNNDIPAEAVPTNTVIEIKETGSSTLIPSKKMLDSYGTKDLGAVKNSDLPGVPPFIAQMAKVLLGLPLSDVKNALLAFQQAAPAADDVFIPRASNLAKAGIKFCKTETIMGIHFDKSEAVFYLPVIQVSVHTEVIIRNLVAYEAITLSNSLQFARYVELMSGLIKTVDDVKLLRDSKILISPMKDNDVKSIFTGASKPIQLTGDIKQDPTITAVRKFYNDSWNAKVRMWTRMPRYKLWKIMALLAILLYMLLTALHSFCSAYKCARLHGTGGSA